MDERHFRRMRTFDGGKETDWKEWGFQFRVAVTASNLHVAKVMSWIENQADEASQEDIVLEFKDAEYIDRLGCELYDILCMLLTGEPLLTIQGAKDMNGFRAWQKLVMKYHPVTPARGGCVCSRPSHPRRRSP